MAVGGGGAVFEAASRVEAARSTLALKRAEVAVSSPEERPSIEGGTGRVVKTCGAEVATPSPYCLVATNRAS